MLQNARGFETPAQCTQLSLSLSLAVEKTRASSKRRRSRRKGKRGSRSRVSTRTNTHALPDEGRRERERGRRVQRRKRNAGTASTHHAACSLLYISGPVPPGGGCAPLSLSSAAPNAFTTQCKRPRGLSPRVLSSLFLLRFAIHSSLSLSRDFFRERESICTRSYSPGFSLALSSASLISLSLSRASARSLEKRERDVYIVLLPLSLWAARGEAHSHFMQRVYNVYIFL